MLLKNLRQVAFLTRPAIFFPLGCQTISSSSPISVTMALAASLPLVTVWLLLTLIGIETWLFPVSVASFVIAFTVVCGG